jgi:hypothetical protein
VDKFINGAKNKLRDAVPVSVDSTAFVDKALESLHHCAYDHCTAFDTLKNSQWSPIHTAQWSIDEVSAFEQGFIECGKDLQSLQKKVH